MCGLAGGINQPASLVRSMLKKIEHRGGDGQGVIESGTATHGHVRLALLDLTEASSQPFKYHDTVLSFNGEIWNYRELRAELENRGVKFHTTGDTEVLAAMLYEYGKAALCPLEGMRVTHLGKFRFILPRVQQALFGHQNAKLSLRL